MANKCSYCGGILELINGKMKCPYCGSYENANITDELEILLQTASQQLRMGNFDFAEAQYSDITKRFPDIADGFWGLLLARYGIKYEQDFDGKYIPTCYATSYESFYDSPAYKKAISLADSDNLAYFEEQAKVIEDIRKRWVDKASKEKPYDIFISFKDRRPQAENSESQKLCDERDRTTDSNEAYDLYNELTRKGYRVFFSRVSLRDKSGEAYEPYIFNALNTAKVMILYSSNPEYIESTWVKNEWTRFVKKIKNKEKSENSLIIVYKDFDLGQLPSSLSRLQVIDRNSMSFMEDLLNNIKKAMGNVIKNPHSTKAVVSKTEKKELNDNRVVITPEVSNMLNIADKCLSKGMFKDAKEQYLKVLESDDNNGHALLGKILSDYKFKTIDDLCKNIERVKVESIGILEKTIQYIDSEVAKKILENLSMAILEKMEKYYLLLEPFIESLISFNFDKREEFLRNVLNFYIVIENKKYFVKYIEEYLAIDENKRLAYVNGFLEIIFNENRTYKVLPIFDELERYFPENTDDLLIKSLLQAGELCLRTEEKEFKKNNLAKKCENYFTEAITINEKCHEAYWGLLKVHVGAKNDDGLVDSNTDISTQVDYTNATIAASNVDEKVLDYYLDIKDRQQAVLKQKKAKKIRKIVFTSIICAMALALAAFIFIVQPLQNKEAITSYIEKGDYKAALAQYNSGLTYGYKEEDKPKLEAGSLLQDNDYEAALDVIYENGGTAEISYDGNGGDVSMDSETIKRLSVTTSGEASKPGYYFSGWEMTDYSFDFDEFSANITLKAKYDLVTYNFSYDLDGGLLLNVPESTFDVEHEVTINNPTKVGYTFVGWAVDGEEDVYETFSTKGRIGNTWIKALWEANEYKITFVDSLTDYNENVAILYDGEITFPELTKDGYVFVGWTYNNNDYINENYNFAFDVELFAKWEIVTYNVTYHNVLGNNQNVLTFTCLDKITLLDVEKTNYNFIGWFSDEALTNEITEIDGSYCKNIDIYAKYDCKVYEVTYINAYDNTNPVSFTIDTVDYNLVAPTTIGRTFDGWYYNDTKIENLSECFSGEELSNIELTAKWNNIIYNITYLGVDGLVNPNPLTYDIDTETIVLSPVSKDYYEFSGWINSTTSESALTIEKGSTGDICFEAIWNAINYTITYHNVNNAVNPNRTSYNILDGDIIISDITRDGYEFVNWYSDIDCTIVAEKVIKSGSHGNLDYYAKWNVTTFSITYVNASNASNPNNYTILSDNINLLDGERDYYEFNGWYDNESFNGDPITCISKGSFGDITLYAKTTPITYNITYISDIVGFTHDNVTTYTVESDDIILKDASCDYYSFVKWVDLNEQDVTTIVKGSHGDITLEAKFTPVDYTITYVLNGENIENNNPAGYNYEEEVFLANPSRLGYNFLGWYTESSYQNKVDKIEIGENGNKVFYANWDIIIYTISYNNVNGLVNDNAKQYTVNDEISLVPIEKDYYDFVGWVDQSNNTISKINKGTTGDITLTANFVPTEYTITYVLNGGTNNQNNPVTYTVLDEVTFLDPTRSGYNFLGWYTEDTFDNEIEGIDEGSHGNITIYANWEIITYNITYPAGINIGDNPTIYTVEDEITLTAGSKDYYTFNNWLLNNSVITKIEKGTTGDITLGVSITPIDYKITYVLNGGTNNPNSPATYTVLNAVTFLDPTRKGYSFLGWYTEDTFDNEIEGITLGSHGNITIYANWEIITYNITYPAGITHSNPTIYTVEDEITLTAGSKDYYTFNNWLLNNSVITKINKGTTGDITLGADIPPTVYTITYVLNGGTNNPNNPATYTVLDEFTFLDPIRSGYEFLGWYTESTFDNEIEGITLGSHGNITLYANIGKIITYKITYPAGITHSNPTTYTVEDEITLSAGSKDYYTFNNWLYNNSVITKINKGTTGDITLTADLTPMTYSITYSTYSYDTDGDALKCSTSTTGTVSKVTYGTTTYIGYGYPTSYSSYYSFAGWYTSSSGGTKVADASGNLLASVSGYTNSSKQWIKTSSTTLYPHWTKVYSGKYISTWSEFSALSGKSSGTYHLICDINVNGSITPLTSFGATLYGHNNCIYNFSLSATGTGSANIGLINSNTGTINGLKVGMSGITSKDGYSASYTVTYNESSTEDTLNVGGLCGINSGSIVSCSVINVKFSSSFSDKNNDKAIYMNLGGLVGKTTGGSISSCSVSYCNFTGQMPCAENSGDDAYGSFGGIVGYNSYAISSSSFTNNSVYIRVYCDGKYKLGGNNIAYPNAYVGGIVGWNISGTVSSATAKSNSYTVIQSYGAYTFPTYYTGYVVGRLDGGSDSSPTVSSNTMYCKTGDDSLTWYTYVNDGASVYKKK